MMQERHSSGRCLAGDEVCFLFPLVAATRKKVATLLPHSHQCSAELRNLMTVTGLPPTSSLAQASVCMAREHTPKTS